MSVKFYLILLFFGLLAWFFPRLLRPFDQVEAWVRRLTAFRAALLALILSVGLNAALARFVWWPAPRVHDEFSYLLAADTFAHGRLTNPTHPMWPHLEAIHVLQEPTRTSKYQPGQGLLLALGQKLGSPVFGLWIGSAAVTLAVFYLLSAWLSTPWALFGSALCVFHPLILAWSHGFWGASVQATGGSLLLGAASRAVKRPHWNYGFLIGIAVALLAISRPYEGALFTLLTAGTVAVCLLRSGGRTDAVRALLKLLPGLIPPMVALACFLGIYNKAVTGNPLTMPYAAYEKTYGNCPLFVWQKAGPLPAYRHPIFEQMGRVDRGSFNSQRTAQGFLKAAVRDKLGVVFYEFTWMWLLLIPFAFAFRSREHAGAVRTGAALLAALFAADLLVVWMFPHYVAPVFGLFIALTVVGFREMRRAAGERAVAVSRVLVVSIMAASVLFYVIRAQKHRKLDRWELDRLELIARLEKLPGRSLVLVSTAPNHNPNENWVQNAADVDSAKVVWAHSMADNSALLQYFPNRKIWAITVNSDRYQLTPPLP